MPNLQDANLVGHDEGGHSYAAWTGGSGRPGQATLWDRESSTRSQSGSDREPEQATGLSKAARCGAEWPNAAARDKRARGTAWSSAMAQGGRAQHGHKGPLGCERWQ